MKENNVPGLGNPDDAQLRRTACTPESHIEQWRKKPVVIEAVQWTGENAGDILFWIGRYHPKGQMAKTAFIDGDTGTLKIKTLESGNGYHIADVGDYIIKGVKNEFYACKPDIFMMTYELNQGEDEAQRQRIVETEAQPENQAPTTQLNQKEFDLLVNGRFDNPVSDDAPLLPPTTQQDRPVLSGEGEYYTAEDMKNAIQSTFDWATHDPHTVDEKWGDIDSVADFQTAYLNSVSHISLPAPVVQDVEQLRQIFLNNFNCYAESEKVIPAMDVECFISVVAELPQSLSKQSAPLQEEMAGQTDSDLLGWLEGLMSKDADYCEIFFAGLRNFTGEASAYQVESNPQRFETVNAPTLREAIKKAYAQSLQHRGEGLGSRGQ